MDWEGPAQVINRSFRCIIYVFCPFVNDIELAAAKQIVPSCSKSEFFRMTLFCNDLYLKAAKADFSNFQKECRVELNGLRRYVLLIPNLSQ